MARRCSRECNYNTDDFCYAEGGCVKPPAPSAGSPLENFRAEMERAQKQFAECSQSFLDLGAYKDVAECAMKAETLKWVIGRIPRER